MQRQVDIEAINFDWPNSNSKIRSLDITQKSCLSEFLDYFRFTLLIEENLYFFNDKQCSQQISELEVPILKLGISKIYCKKSRIMLLNYSGQAFIKVYVLINNIQKEVVNLQSGFSFMDLINQQGIKNILEENKLHQIDILNKFHEKIENEQLYVFTNYYQPYYFNIVIEQDQIQQYSSEDDKKSSQKSISYTDESTKSEISERKQIILISNEMKWQSKGVEVNYIKLKIDTKLTISQFKLKLKKHEIVKFDCNLVIYNKEQLLIMEDDKPLSQYIIDDNTVVNIEKI